MRRPPIAPAVAEFLGTAAMIFVGLSAVSIDFGSGAPIASAVPNALIRRLITGTVFASGAAIVVYSTLGRISGGHLNPAVTLAFLRLGKVTPRLAGAYAVAQVAGALVAAAAISLVWGTWARSVSDGVTVPGPQGLAAALVAETLMTFALVELILQFMRRPALARFTPIAASVLVATLVTIEAPLSGTSLNPARSLGPAVVSGVFTDFWLYVVGPLAGALAAAVFADRVQGAFVPCAKLFHDAEFACHFPDCAYQGRHAWPAQLPEPSPTASRRGQEVPR